MMIARFAPLFLVALLLVSGRPANAAPEPVLDLLDPPVAYTAQFFLRGDRGTYRGTVWHAPGRELREFDTQGGGQAVLLRRDTGTAYLLKPSGRWYVGMALSAAAGLAGGLDGMVVSRTRVKEESVAGLRAVRYRVEASAPKGDRFAGDAWFSRDGILVRAVGTVTTRGGRSMPVETGLSAIRVGKVEDSRFDLPSGWLGMDLSGIPADRLEQAVESLRPMLERR